jgi:hypothetical protein
MFISLNHIYPPWFLRDLKLSSLACCLEFTLIALALDPDLTPSIDLNRRPLGSEYFCTYYSTSSCFCPDYSPSVVHFFSQLKADFSDFLKGESSVASTVDKLR